MSGADPNEHAKYCHLCDQPNYSDDFDICAACSKDLYATDDDGDEWGGMSWTERVGFFYLNWENGNITDAINFLMHDGDVRPDSVLLLAHIVDFLDSLPDTHLHTDTIHKFISSFIRSVDKWERT